ncbi:hypothetical protein [Pelagibius sp.]|uniref:hypothetical protein n=1 Tax=Pelagibius sp. TaxID=1931238 RepID=UPI00260D9C32|nr:hypothetical protein [Pelagibius sp.]
MVQDESETPGAAASVRGHRIPKRRFTRWALYYFLLYVCLPVLLLGALFDGLLYLVFTGLFGRCYAIFCLLS